MIPAIGLATLALVGTSIPAARASETVIVRPAFTGGSFSTKTQILASPAETITPSFSSKPSGTTAEAIGELRAETSFTWEQVAKLFGVSRRTVHMWAAGGKMAAHNEEQLSTVLNEVRDLRASAPMDERMRLLHLLDSHRAQHASRGSDINRPADVYAPQASRTA